MKTKGQAFMSDFAVSIAVFSVIVAAFFVPWNAIVEADNRFSQEEKMQTDAQRTAAFLVTTQGYPDNWENEDVEVIIPGFASSSDNILSSEKIEEFAKKEYEAQRSLLKNQGFSLEYVDTETEEILEYNQKDEGLSPAKLGKEPVAYIAGGTSFDNLEMLDDLNSSDREWYFYFASNSNQDEIDSLTAEQVYVDTGGNTKQLFEKMITEASGKGWKPFDTNGGISASKISFTGDIDGDGRLEVFYQGSGDRLNVYHISEDSKETLDIGTRFRALGGIGNFTAQPGLELAYIDQNNRIAFYNYDTEAVDTTETSASDIGAVQQNETSSKVFFSTTSDNLGYYSTENGETVTSNNAGKVGGTGDIEGDGNIELAYQNGNDNLEFYEISTGDTESIAQQVSDVGGISKDVVVVESSSNTLGLWNYSRSELVSTDLGLGSVSSLSTIGNDQGLDVLAFDSAGDLGYYDFSLNLKYNTVISEATEQTNLNPDNSDLLVSSVDKGLRYIHSGYADDSILQNGFGMSYQSEDGTAQVIENTSLLNSNFSEGDSIDFTSPGGFTGVDTSFAESNGVCMACMQNFGEGEVYYLADTSTVSGDQSAFSDVDRVFSRALEFENPFDVGRDIGAEAETVVVVNRQVAVNKSGVLEKAELRYHVWN